LKKLLCEGTFASYFCVFLGRVSEIFILSFQATRSFSGVGDLAVDDLTYINCALPTIASSGCGTDEWW